MGNTCESCSTCNTCMGDESRPIMENSVPKEICDIVDQTINTMEREQKNLSQINNASEIKQSVVVDIKSQNQTHSKLECAEGGVPIQDTVPISTERRIHYPPDSKAKLVQEMNPIADIVNAVRDKLPTFEKTFDMKITYYPDNPELGPFIVKSTKSSYYGGFRSGNFEGYGTQIWKDGSIYEGMFGNDLANGKGRLINEDGGCYIGDFQDAKANGYGEYFNQEGIYYQGEFKMNLRDGYGEEKFSDGSVYKGNYSKGSKVGQGTFQWKDGSSYVGAFNNNFMDGFGVYIWADGRKFEGNWSNNNINGKGTFQWPDGKKYVGDYENDKKSGYGEFTFVNGDVYRGQWKDGKRSGKGELTGKDNNGSSIIKKGTWEKGSLVLQT